MNNRKLWGIALSTAIFCYFLSTITGSVYVNSDNVVVGLITNGYFGRHAFCQYLHPGFSIFVYELSRLLPSADMFAVTVHVLTIAELTVLSYFGYSKAFVRNDSKIVKALQISLTLLGLLFLSFSINIWNINYTVQTAMFVFTGILGLFGAEEISRKRCVCSTLFICMGFLMRNVAGLLFIPYFVLEFLTQVFESDDKKSKCCQLIQRSLPCIGLCAMLFLTQEVFYTVEPYASDRAFNVARTTIFDYPMKSWSEAKERYCEPTDVSGAEYIALTSWILADTDVMNVDSLQAAAEAGGKNKHPYTLEGLRNAMKDMRTRIVNTDVQLLMFLGILIVLSIGIFLRKSGRWRKVEALSAMVGSFIILLYFTFRGRALWHVWYCVLIAACSVMILAAFRDRPDKISDKALMPEKGHIGESFLMLSLCAVLYFSIGQRMIYTTVHTPRTALTTRSYFGDPEYEKTYEEGAIYIWPEWHSRLKSIFYNTDRLPSGQFIEHNVAMGDWTYGQEYYREYLQRLGVENPAAAAIDRPNTYIMDGNLEPFMQYMQACYGDDLILREVDVINGVKAYKLEHSTKDKDTIQ